MEKIYRLTESELIDVVKKSIDDLEQERLKNVFSKINSDINMSRGVGSEKYEKDERI